MDAELATAMYALNRLIGARESEHPELHTEILAISEQIWVLRTKINPSLIG